MRLRSMVIEAKSGGVVVVVAQDLFQEAGLTTHRPPLELPLTSQLADPAPDNGGYCFAAPTRPGPGTMQST